MASSIDSGRWPRVQALVATGAKLSRAEIVAIHGTYGHLMLRRCQVVLRDHALAEDAFQEAFINLIRYGAAFREAEKKLAWLYRLVDRCCFRVLDKKKKAPTAASEAVLELAVHPHQELRSEALAVLGQLDEEARQIAVLFFVDGLSQGEVGARLGRSRQTINKKLKLIRETAAALREGAA